jgi:hypothetical protein
VEPSEADETPLNLPPEVMARLVRAIDRSPSTIVVLLDRDLRIEWISQSVMWSTGSDPEARLGSSALQRIHPDDIDRLLEGIGQLAQSGGTQVGATYPIRYRFQRFDGTWVVMEATVHNLLDDPFVDGLLVFTRPVTGHLNPVDYVVDLLVADMPLQNVLAACAGLIPSEIGTAALVALFDGHVLVGAQAGGPAQRLAVDSRWWTNSAQRSQSMWPSSFAGLPEELAIAGRDAGFCTAWTSVIRDRATGQMIGLLVVWVHEGIERNVAIDQALGRSEQLASMVIAEERRRLSLAAWSKPRWHEWRHE